MDECFVAPIPLQMKPESIGSKRMRVVRLFALLGIGIVAITGCMSQKIVDVRRDMFVNQPLWESAVLATAKPVAAVSSPQNVAGSLELIVKERPGLSMIARQVF